MQHKQLLHSQTNLLSWYATDARDTLPWRQTSDIYHIYLSEIMLQQTQVSRVETEYYPKFLQAFPTLKSLSEASLEEVFSLWSGLGYYARAKNLHETAKLMPNGLPDTQDALLKLPGIGKYTASAICSFGYEQVVSVVDTNIARVLARFFAKEQVKDKELWQLADTFLNHKDTRAHNLALMDLGAMICTPKNPKCNVCPLLDDCKGRETPDLFYKRKKTVYVDKTLYYGVCIENEKIAMYTSKEGMYKDMLELASFDTPTDSMDFLGTFKHSVTHYRLEVYVYLIDRQERDVVWIDIKNLENAPISSLTHKALKIYQRAA